MPSRPSERHSRAHMREMLGIDVGAGKSQRFDADLVELPEAPFLRALVAEHRAPVPQALRPP